MVVNIKEDNKKDVFLCKYCRKKLQGIEICNDCKKLMETNPMLLIINNFKYIFYYFYINKEISQNNKSLKQISEQLGINYNTLRVLKKRGKEFIYNSMNISDFKNISDVLIKISAYFDNPK